MCGFVCVSVFEIASVYSTTNAHTHTTHTHIHYTHILTPRACTQMHPKCNPIHSISIEIACWSSSSRGFWRVNKCITHSPSHQSIRSIYEVCVCVLCITAGRSHFRIACISHTSHTHRVVRIHFAGARADAHVATTYYKEYEVLCSTRDHSSACCVPPHTRHTHSFARCIFSELTFRSGMCWGKERKHQMGN